MGVPVPPLVPLPQNHVYGRFLIYTDRIPDASVHWTIAHGDGPVGTLTGAYNYGGMGGLMANYYRDTAPDPNDCWQRKYSEFPSGRWVCVGFEVTSLPKLLESESPERQSLRSLGPGPVP